MEKDYTFKDERPLIPHTKTVTSIDEEIKTSIRCPHCNQMGVFVSIVKRNVRFAKMATNKTGGIVSVTMQAGALQCPNELCQGVVFICRDPTEKINKITYPAETVGFEPNGIPAHLVATLSEAISCHANGSHRASAMMVRRLLEELCEENAATGNNLHDKLGKLKTKVVLPNELFEAMMELKALGNDAAHIEAKAYQTIGSGEAEDGIELAKEILKALYQLKDLVGRLKSRKNAPTP